VDLHAEKNLNVSGDVVGRNKITQPPGTKINRITQTGSGIVIDNSGEQDGENVTSGGINFGGGKITIGGNAVGQDQTVNISGDSVSGGITIVGRDDNSVTGWSAKDVESFFTRVTQKIDAKPELAPTDKEDLKAEVQDLQTEVAKGEEANESFLERRLRNIKRMAPDILDTIATTLADPKVGLAMVIRKVMIKAKAGA
jgi:hypothetical protein